MLPPQVKNEETLVSQTMRKISQQHIIMLTGGWVAQGGGYMVQGEGRPSLYKSYP